MHTSLCVHLTSIYIYIYIYTHTHTQLSLGDTTDLQTCAHIYVHIPHSCAHTYTCAPHSCLHTLIYIFYAHIHTFAPFCVPHTHMHKFIVACVCTPNILYLVIRNLSVWKSGLCMCVTALTTNTIPGYLNCHLILNPDVSWLQTPFFCSDFCWLIQWVSSFLYPLSAPSVFF